MAHSSESLTACQASGKYEKVLFDTSPFLVKLNPQSKPHFKIMIKSLNFSKLFLITGIGAFTVISSISVALAADGWVNLFDGKTLKGWTQKSSGIATYRVEGGAIVGKTAEGSSNSFLCSDKTYGDFELEFDVKDSDKLNSGVQIRSNEKNPGDKKKSRVNGPQVEIEASPGQAGWIYGEATGLGWLSKSPKSKDAKVNSHTHFKNGEWNHFRIVAKGNNIQTWINGNKVADLTHDEIFKTHPSGFIGLQVHGIKKGTGPYEVSWKNIRIKELK